MNKFTSIKYAAVLLPAFAMGSSVASADNQSCDCPCAPETTSVSAESSHAEKGSKQAAMNSERRMHSAREAQAEHESMASGDAKVAVVDFSYLASKPADDYFSSNLIGHDVMNRRDNKVVGTVNELLIDENGQIGAVIISTGGVMGLGKKDLAIAWNEVDRKVDGENITLSVDVSSVSLVEAPTFARK
ncbi:PRC-barrel domain-containing protein [Wenzhouxiangella sp. EGI_FJ10409]|uniref:PRC-barrel domain-containing protein n=1 Tax=Wenzhouxiangella sp. EGI_FJ10409 TaxID=3243767 RepID=UPI0035DE9D3F